MKSGFSRLFFLFLVAVQPPPGALGQSIPVDHFSALRFDAPVPARVLAGQQVPLSATLLDTTWQEVLFSFRPVRGPGPDLDFRIQHLPGRIERSLVFSTTQADTYDVVLFGGDRDELGFNGVFGPFVVLPAEAGLSLPALFFDGLRLDLPLPTQVAAGAAVRMAGQILDPRIVSARLDLSRDGVESGVIHIALDNGRFDMPLRLPPSASFWRCFLPDTTWPVTRATGFRWVLRPLLRVPRAWP
ncbi:MAG: hypothetical protein O2782_22615 [bacterium]|nr:hypothetical protein [bacterium]